MPENKEQLIKKSLRYSIWDGAFWAGMFSLGESYFFAFAVFLRATSWQMGILGSLPQLLGSASQLFTNNILSKVKSRQKVAFFGSLLQGLIFLFIILSIFLGAFKVYYFIVFVCFYYIFGMIILPAWNSWMGDLVKADERGSYFGKRNRVIGIVLFATFLLGGLFLQLFAGRVTTEYIGFILIFVLAMFCRLGSAYFLTKQYEPAYQFYGQLSLKVANLKQHKQFKNILRIVGFIVFMNFSIAIIAPFFAQYILSELRFNYAQFMLIVSMALLAKFLTMPLWGNLIDRYGNRKLIVLVGMLLPLNAILFMFGQNFWYLMLVQFYNGFIFAGFEIITFNYLYDTTDEKNRPTWIAYYGVVNGITIFFGAMFGAFLMQWQYLLFTNYQVIFLASFLLRYVTTYIFVPRLQEVRRVKPISYKRLLWYLFSFHPRFRGV